VLETIGYVALASTAAAGGAAALFSACRRRHSGAVRPGAFHLASHVGEISETRFRLRLPEGSAPPRRRAIKLLRPG
jgi:hypothetical protein